MPANSPHPNLILVSLCLADECHRPNCQRSRADRRYTPEPGEGFGAIVPIGGPHRESTDVIGRCKAARKQPTPAVVRRLFRSSPPHEWGRDFDEARAILRRTRAKVNLLPPDFSWIEIGKPDYTTAVSLNFLRSKGLCRLSITWSRGRRNVDEIDEETCPIMMSHGGEARSRRGTTTPPNPGPLRALRAP